jgi:CDP-paratose 2-epimerase
MKIAVTGGAGFLGSNICIKARERGYDVVAFDNFVRHGSDRNARILSSKHGVEVVHGEVRIQDDWKKIENVDAIIHLAGQPGIPASLENPVFDFQVNALGTLYGLNTARKNKIPFIYASTNKIYSDAINEIELKEADKRYKYHDQKYAQGIPETFPMDSSGHHPHSPYGVSKASGDLLTQEFFHAFEVPTVVFRMSCIYGLYQNGVSEQGWTDFFVRQRILGDNKLIFYGNGKQVRDVLFGTDAAEAYLLALENIDRLKGNVFNLGGGLDHNASLIEWVEILNKYEDKPPMEISYEDWRLADHRVYISDTSKFKKTTNWIPKVGVEEGIKTMIEAYKGNLYEL